MWSYRVAAPVRQNGEGVFIAHIARGKQTVSLLLCLLPQEPMKQKVIKGYFSTDQKGKCLKSSFWQHCDAPEVSRKISSLPFPCI